MVFRRKPVEEMVIPGIERLKKPKDMVKSLRRVDDILSKYEEELSDCIVEDINRVLVDYFDACNAGADAQPHVVGASLARTIFRCINVLDATLPEMEGSLKSFVQTIEYYYKVQKKT